MLARPELNQAQVDLLAAACHLEEVGLAKYIRVDDHQVGPDDQAAKCVLGAIGYVALKEPWFGIDDDATDRANAAVNLLAKFLPEGPYSGNGCNAAEWNNDDARTLEEVVDKLKEAALSPVPA